MLPVLPFIIGGALGAVAGVALKKYYDENEYEIHCIYRSIRTGMPEFNRTLLQ